MNGYAAACACAAETGVPPSRFTQGDTLRWTVPVGSYPPADGWAWSTLLLAGSVKVTATGTPSADGASVEFVVTAALSATFPPGPLAWQMHVSKDPDGYVLAAGRSLVLPNLATAPPGFSPLTPAERVLLALEAAVETIAANPEVSMMVDGMTVQWRSLDEFQRLLAYYRQLVLNQQAATAGASGCGPRGNRRVVQQWFTPV